MLLVKNQHEPVFSKKKKTLNIGKETTELRRQFLIFTLYW